MKLFEYAVVFVGKKDKDGEWTERPAILVQPTTGLFADERAATLAAARTIPDGYGDRLELIQVAVRPF